MTGEYGKPLTSVVINVHCHGKGTMSQVMADQMKADQDLWCECGNPSGESIFHDDGMHPQCSKHCYTCQDCGKITQIG